MKLSQDIEKVTIPGKKEAFRLYGGDGEGVDFALSIWGGGGGGRETLIFSYHLSREIAKSKTVLDCVTWVEKRSPSRLTVPLETLILCGKVAIALIGVISGFNTQTRLKGHSPLY